MWVTEEDILSLDDKPEELRKYTQRFLDRDLFKRALVISANTVNNPAVSPGYKAFTALADQPANLKNLRRELVAELNNKYPLHDIWIDLPQTLTFEDDNFAVIQDPGEEPQYMRDRFRVSEWLTAYGSNKWKGYVFCPPGADVRKEVGIKAAELISSKYGFSIDIPKALQQAKIR